MADDILIRSIKTMYHPESLFVQFSYGMNNIVFDNGMWVMIILSDSKKLAKSFSEDVAYYNNSDIAANNSKRIDLEDDVFD